MKIFIPKRSIDLFEVWTLFLSKSPFDSKDKMDRIILEHLRRQETFLMINNYDVSSIFLTPQILQIGSSLYFHSDNLVELIHRQFSIVIETFPSFKSVSVYVDNKIQSSKIYWTKNEITIENE